MPWPLRWRTPSDRSAVRSPASPANAPSSSRGIGTSITSSGCLRRWRMLGRNVPPDAPRAPSVADGPTVVRGRLRAWLAPGVDLTTVVAADGNADRLLTRIECRIVKLQRKVVVGRITSALGVLYVKRYNVFSWRVALGSLGRPSPAVAAWRAAGALAARGFGTPE